MNFDNFFQAEFDEDIPRPGSEFMVSIEDLRLIWKAAQEDMRERAADVCATCAKSINNPFGGIEQGYKNACDDFEISIRALPIEV